MKYEYIRIIEINSEFYAKNIESIGCERSYALANASNVSRFPYTRIHTLPIDKRCLSPL